MNKAKLTIAQPYCVLWNEADRNKDGDVARWIMDNVLSPYDLIVLNSAQKVELLRDGERLGTEVSHFGPNDSLFMFSCPRDALLFKLTWGGR
jgi:hypothetical protein